jgi:hypothetical protein
MYMLTLYNFLPLHCPSCGTPKWLDRVDNPLVSKFKAKQADVLRLVGLHVSLVQLRILWGLLFGLTVHLCGFAPHQSINS